MKKNESTKLFDVLAINKLSFALPFLSIGTGEFLSFYRTTLKMHTNKSSFDNRHNRFRLDNEPDEAVQQACLIFSKGIRFTILQSIRFLTTDDKKGSALNKICCSLTYSYAANYTVTNSFCQQIQTLQIQITHARFFTTNYFVSIILRVLPFSQLTGSREFMLSTFASTCLFYPVFEHFSTVFAVAFTRSIKKQNHIICYRILHIIHKI